MDEMTDGGVKSAAWPADAAGDCSGLDAEQTAAIVEAIIARYCADRRSRLRGFVDRHYGFGGAARLHRRALGWDLLRAPANLLLILPRLTLATASMGARAASRRLHGRPAARLGRLAAWLGGIRLFLKTDVAAEIEWRLYTEMLELPYEQAHPRHGERVSTRDAIAEAIRSDPCIDAPVRNALAADHRARDPEFRARLAEAVSVYLDSRVAAGDIAASLLSIGVGALAVRQFTPGALSLGPTVATALAQHAAITEFPLGAWLGALWYSVFPVTAGPLLDIGVTIGLLAGAAAFTAVAGILVDPVQRRLGLHQRRLTRLLAAVEQELVGRRPISLTLHDHYAARVLDLVDMLRAAQRLVQ